MQLQKLESVLCDYLRNKDLRITKQRRTVLDVFAQADAHLTVEELYNKTREKDPSIGVATVYRMVNLLCECGLACGFKHSDGTFRYELEKEYHNHLICVKCGRLVEGREPEVEKLQNKLAQKNKFHILHTRVDVYGICPDCLENR